MDRQGVVFFMQTIKDEKGEDGNGTDRIGGEVQGKVFFMQSIEERNGWESRGKGWTGAEWIGVER